MTQVPYDQRLARVLVRPLARARVHPTVVTVLALALALAAAAGFASGRDAWCNWAAGVFVISRFLDHFDGELARQTGRSTRLGYLLDYLAGGVSYAALFFGIAWGQFRGDLGSVALLLGGAATVCALLAVLVNMGIEEVGNDGQAHGYPGLAGFELEDGIYLLAPVTWVGFLTPFFVLCTLGAVVYLLVSLWHLLRLRSARDG